MWDYKPSSSPMGFMARRPSPILPNIWLPCLPVSGPMPAPSHARSNGEAMTTVYLDELKPGMSAAMEHTVTERDIQLFGEATGDMNPVHFDEEFARKTVFRGRVAHGALSIGLISALLGTKLPGNGSIFPSASIVFKLPIRNSAKDCPGVLVSKFALSSIWSAMRTSKPGDTGIQQLLVSIDSEIRLEFDI